MDTMKERAIRLGIVAALFAGWIGYLIYLVTMTRESAIISRPQILVSGLDVVADVQAKNDRPGAVTVKEVLWPRNDQTRALAGQTIQVVNLDPQCKGWTGAGTYLLALTSLAGNTYQVTPTPPSPGFASGPPFIYPATPDVVKQYASIEKPGG